MLKNALAEGQPELLATFLEEHPNEENRLVQAAIAQHESFQNRRCLIIAMALLQANRAGAVGVLRRLADHDKNLEASREHPVPWRRLGTEDFWLLRDYLRQHQQDSLRYDLLKQLPPESGLHLMVSVEDPAFPDDLDVYLGSSYTAQPVAEALLARLDELAVAGRTPGVGDQTITSCVTAAEKIWEKNHINEALALMVNLSLLQPQSFVREWLPAIASRLQELSGLEMVRAARLLKRYPSSQWILPLKQAWLRIAKPAKEQAEGVNAPRPLPPEVLAHAASVLVALGTCAACDPGYTAIESVEPEVQELEQTILVYNSGVEEHRRLVREHRSNPEQRKAIEEQIVELQSRLTVQGEQINRMKLERTAQLSAGYLLLLVLQDSEAFPSAIRQAAAWGLCKLCQEGNLDQISRDRIRGVLRRCISDLNETELQAAVEKVVPDESSRALVAQAALAYYFQPNLNQLIEGLNSLPLQEQDKAKILTTIRAFAYTKPSQHFRERNIQILEGQRLFELEDAILEGLRWMHELLGIPESGEAIDFGQVRATLKLLQKTVPGALRFLSRYPLRLMTLEHHKRLLGEYSRIRGGLEFWTRYSGRPWRRGMQSGEAGNVQSRYIRIDDRTVPNSMGICASLFRHPVLALPVIYHEQMHYGGAAGDPRQGIENETEVLLREIIFARGLIARMAPQDDREIPNFERELIREIDGSGLQGLKFQLFFDLQDDSVLNSVCEHIKRTYGEQLASTELDQQVSYLIAEENESIQLMNTTNEAKLNWDPEIQWSDLDTPEMQVLTTEYRRILYQSLAIDHTIDAARRDLIVNDPSCRESLDDWDAYTRRSYALQEFKKACSISTMSWFEILSSVINRVGPIPDADPRGLWGMLLRRVAAMQN